MCSGYDGIGLGLSLVISGYQTVCYVEREAYAVENLISKMEAGAISKAPIWDDICTFPAVSAQFEGVDIVHAGLPCQPFSVAGQQRGLDDELPLQTWCKAVIKNMGSDFALRVKIGLIDWLEFERMWADALDIQIVTPNYSSFNNAIVKGLV